MVTLWCEHAWLDGPTTAAGVVLRVESGRIISVATGVGEPPPEAETVRGLTIPGLVNAHSHAFQRALRGRTHGNGGTFWTWREQMYRLAGELDPETVLALTTAAFGEMALAGITAVGEFHYLHHGPGGVPYAEPNTMGIAVAEAAARAGVRLTLLDACYLHGGIGRDPDPVQLRFADRDVSAWAERVAALRAGIGPSVLVGAAAHSVRALTPEEIAALVAAIPPDMPLHAHLSEQPAENADSMRAYGRTPARVFSDAGALGARFTAVHATHLQGDDAALLGAAGANVVLCPTTERDLGDGIGPAEALLREGVQLGLGSDSHAVIDLFEDSRAVELDARLASRARGRIEPHRLLDAATRGGSRSLGRPDGGVLRPGAPADLCVVALDSVRLIGADDAALVAGVVFAATSADVRHVMVAGRWIVRDGVHLLLGDVPALLGSSIARAWERAGERAVERAWERAT